MHAYACICMYMHAHACICMRGKRSVSFGLHDCGSLEDGKEVKACDLWPAHIYIYIYVYTCIYMYMYRSICMFMYMHVYIYNEAINKDSHSFSKCVFCPCALHLLQPDWLSVGSSDSEQGTWAVPMKGLEGCFYPEAEGGKEVKACDSWSAYIHMYIYIYIMHTYRHIICIYI